MKTGVEHSDKVFTVFGVALQEVDEALMLQQSHDLSEVHVFSGKFVERMLLHNSPFADIFVEGFDASGWNE
jgi:hypothetical protein